MITHKFIDYMAYNIARQSLPLHERGEAIPPITNYKHGEILPNGVRIFSGHNKTDKHKVIASGQPLAIMRKDFTDYEIIEDILARGGNITRIDMAMDMYVVDDLITPDEFIQFYTDGEIVSSHVMSKDKKIKPSFYGIVEDGEIQFETLNFGDRTKRGKHGMVRAYDKGVQLDIGKYLITRLEVEDKQKKAHASAKRIVECGSIASVMKTRFDVKNERYQGAIDAPSIDITRGTGVLKELKDDTNNRWQWLIDSCANSLGRAIADDEDNALGNGNKDMFIKAMDSAYDVQKKLNMSKKIMQSHERIMSHSKNHNKKIDNNEK